MAWEGSRDGECGGHARGATRVSVWPRRRPAVPSHARRWLESDERVLTFATTPYGDLIVATQRGLWVADHGNAVAGPTAPDPGGRLLRWEFIVTAKWAGDVLTVTSAQEVEPSIMRRLPAISLSLPEPADLPRVVQQRVDRSVAVSRRRTLGTGSTALVVGRRVSGRDGLLWYAVFDRDSDASDPELRRAAAAVVQAAAGTTTPAEPD